MILLVALVVALEYLMQVVAVSLGYCFEDVVGILSILSHLVLHLLTLAVQPRKLLLEASEEFPHLFA